MAYEVYIDDMLLPLPPEKIPIKYSGQNKTVNLINGEEINLIRPFGLAEIGIDAIIPQMDYPSAVWDGSIDSAEDFLERLQELKDGKSPFEFTVIRQGTGGNSLFDTSIDVTLEDYKVTDDVSQGLDLIVSLTMKEYKNYGTKIMNFSIVEENQKIESVQPQEERQGEPPPVKTYVVNKGDCLWSIAKKQLGNGSRWQEIHNLNRDKITNPNVIYPGQVLTMP
ncbi:LysM peptidoglycan-binding domain-containing protein [Lacrimispora indolis]|uniref:LysM peptidoglycan-binding domain-containing protein n=1 Tax=Lacrimispora indolis TaxID=69825 RepID=UPI00045E66A4|nr:LysM peptidoglycan-binding domain-containing protein [Lacrimispora indolis]